MDASPQLARTEEWADAFRLIFQHLSAEERERRCSNALHLLQRGQLDPQGIFVLRGENVLRGAVVCLPVPGGSALVWPPGAAADHRIETEDTLLHHVIAWLRQRGIKLAQTLLAPEEAFLAAPLLRHGFALVTQLLYLRHDLQLVASAPGLSVPARLDYRTFDEDPAFGQTLLRTYEGTHDCPEVNGIRSLEEVLQGHRAQGAFDPERWWLALEYGRPVGVLMMTEMPESGEWEVAYMGVTPEYRRRGFGREMLLKALCEARAADVPAVTLSVDARNRPARQLYDAVGFEPVEERAVYLAIFG